MFSFQCGDFGSDFFRLTIPSIKVVEHKSIDIIFWNCKALSDSSPLHELLRVNMLRYANSVNLSAILKIEHSLNE